MKRSHVIIGMTCCTLTAALIGCGQKLTFERFQTVQAGQPRHSVVNTLGEPLADTGDELVYYDPDRQINATIYFDASGEVIGAEWHSPDHGTVGGDPRVNRPGDETRTRVRTIE